MVIMNRVFNDDYIVVADYGEYTIEQSLTNEWKIRERYEISCTKKMEREATISAWIGGIVSLLFVLSLIIFWLVFGY